MSRAKYFGLSPRLDGTFVNFQVLWLMSWAMYLGYIKCQGVWPMSRARDFGQWPKPGTMAYVHDQVPVHGQCPEPVYKNRLLCQCPGPGYLARVHQVQVIEPLFRACLLLNIILEHFMKKYFSTYTVLGCTKTLVVKY